MCWKSREKGLSPGETPSQAYTPLGWGWKTQAHPATQAQLTRAKPCLPELLTTRRPAWAARGSGGKPLIMGLGLLERLGDRPGTRAGSAALCLPTGVVPPYPPHDSSVTIKGQLSEEE